MFRYIRARKYSEQTSLTPEGTIYLTVLIFITIGSVLRNVNLLILMAGMMYAPLFINWRLAVRRMRSFRATRRLPHRLHANQLATVQWECENTYRGMPAYYVVIDDCLVRAEDGEQTSRRDQYSAEEIQRHSRWPRWLRAIAKRFKSGEATTEGSVAKVRFTKLLAHQPDTQSYRAFFGQRGKYIAGPASVSTSFPFGLVASRCWVPRRETFFVAPEMGKLLPTWERRVQSTAVGSDSVKRTRSHEEDEFFALRPWRSGDSKKNIHWRSTARLGFPIIKQHDQQNNRDFALVLDLFQAEGPNQASHLSKGFPGAEPAEIVLSFAATTLLSIGAAVQGQVSVAVCGRRTEFCRSRTAAGIISDSMPALATAETASRTELTRAIVETAESVSAGTPIYVISGRSQPNLPELDAQLMESIYAAGDPVAERKLRQWKRRINQALAMVRWVDIESEEFRSIFSMPRSSAEEMPAGLQQMSEKWERHA